MAAELAAHSRSSGIDSHPIIAVGQTLDRLDCLGLQVEIEYP
jgi:hypothetical protein